MKLPILNRGDEATVRQCDALIRVLNQATAPVRIEITKEGAERVRVIEDADTTNGPVWYVDQEGHIAKFS